MCVLDREREKGGWGTELLFFSVHCSLQKNKEETDLKSIQVIIQS